MFTAFSGNTACNNVAEKATQRDNETLDDEEMLPVAADDTAEKKEDAMHRASCKHMLRAFPMAHSSLAFH